MAQAAARKRATESPPNPEPEPSQNGGEPDHEVTVEEWLDQNRHRCYLHSGGYVWIRIPDLADLLLDEALPEHLERAAVRKLVTEFEQLEDAELQEAATAAEDAPAGPEGDETRKRLEALMENQAKATRGAAELQNRLVLRMVESPKLTRDQLALLPPQDREMLAEIAMRGRGVDARGNVIGVASLAGLEPFRDEPDRAAGRESSAPPRRAVPKSRKSKV